MSESNGRQIFRIERKGKQWIALGDGEPVELDVVSCWNQYVVQDATYFDEAGKIIPGAQLERDNAIIKFARELTGCQDANMAEALEFIHWLRIEKEKLVNFFAPKSKDEQSSPKPSEVIFTE